MLMAEQNRDGLEQLAQQARPECPSSCFAPALLTCSLLSDPSTCLSQRCPPVQAGVTLHRLLQEYGHCVIARELFEGAPNFDSLIEFAESITGQVRLPCASHHFPPDTLDGAGCD